jgi:DNA polymerase-3 subunit alpha
MCDVDPEPAGYHLPKFDVPEGYTTDSFLRYLCEDGLVHRYGKESAANDKELRERLDYELNIIIGMGFAAYFLIVWDLCEFARVKDIWWNVRGSGAGSVVAYTLGITGIDPIANGLIFERFLNPDRVSMPDIDLDYPDDRRHEMIEYTIQKYGSDKVAQIITFGTMGARAAIRDVGRVLDVPLSDVDNLAKLIPAIPGKPVSIGDALNSKHEFFSSELLQKYNEDEEIKALVDTAVNLEGVARHASTHAAGVIISDKPLIEYTPLHRPTSGNANNGDGIGVVTQWPMEILDSIGLLKVDFLGLSTLTILRQAAELIEERCGIIYTMENIPYDVGHVGPDPEKKPEVLFEMLGRGHVAGVFQVEGAGMRRLMIRMKPKRFDHIVAAISLFRPGPMDNIDDFLARMHGKKKITYHHPDLEPILKETYGIVVYQEQIIRIAAEFAGYQPGEADLIRKAVAKKKRKLMDEHRAKFINGAMTRGYSQDECEAIWGDIEFFARYGFNKAHAADYAVITCQTAYLKAHYPVEYMTALMSVERNNTEKVAHYLADARRLDIEVVPPTINKASLDFDIEGDGPRPVIRYGLGAIKNAGTGAIEFILKEREENGPFTSLAEFCERVDLRRVGKRALESMIKVGVFDEWGTRPQMLDSLDRVIGHSGTTNDAAAAGQLSLFSGSSGMNLNVDIELLRPAAELKAIDRREVLNWEKELIGVYISEHPLNHYLNLMSEMDTTPSIELDMSLNGRSVVLLGLITYLRTHVTKKGAAMAFGTLEDLHGTIELLFFPQTWAKFREDVEIDQVFLVRGKVRIENEDRAKVVVNSIESSLSLSQPTEINLNRSPEPTGGKGRNDVGIGVNDDSHYSDENAAPAFEMGEADSQMSHPPPPPMPDLDDAAHIWMNDELLGQDVINAQSEEPVLTREGLTADLQSWDKGYAEPKRAVIVDIEPVSDWQEACRLLVSMANKYNGRDSLRIRLVGHDIAMDFPNQNTLYCPNLVDEMRKLSAVIGVVANK